MSKRLRGLVSQKGEFGSGMQSLYVKSLSNKSAGDILAVGTEGYTTNSAW